MKKSRIFLVLSGLALLFASCSDIDSGSSSITESYKTSKISDKTRTLTMNVTSDDGLLEFPTAKSNDRSARTILPTAVDAGSNTVKFYLAYLDTLGTSAGYTFKTDPVTFTAADDSTTKGTISETFDVSVYKFILYCLPASVNSITTPDLAKANAMFIGYANADLRYADEITFYMTAENAPGKGKVDLKVYSSNKNSTTDLWQIPVGYTVTATINNKNTDAKVAEIASPLLTTSSEKAAINGVAFTPTNEIVAGTYNFVVKFAPTAAESKLPTSYYSDEIVILPNQTTTGDVFVPDILEYAPAAPSAFAVAYADPVADTDDYYFAQFFWSDNSNNEQSFEIELAEANDNASNIISNPTYKIIAAPKNDTEWSSALGSSYYNSTAVPYKWNDYQTSQYNPAPDEYSLLKNSKTAVFKLPLGSRYIARIRAVNEVGNSDWAYLHISGVIPEASKLKYTEDAKTSEIPVTNTKLGSLTMKAFEADDAENKLYTVTVNRFRVKYILDGGKFYGDKTDTDDDIEVKVGSQGYGEAAATPATILYNTQRVKIDTDSTVPGISILNPNCTANTFIDSTGDKKEGVVISLIASNQLFNKWLLYYTTDTGKFVTETGGNRYPVTTAVPDNYTGHANLELFANYAVDTTLQVDVADYTAYEWKGYGDYKTTGESPEVDAKSDVSLTGTDAENPENTIYWPTYLGNDKLDTDLNTDTDKALCTKGDYVQISQSETPTITFTLNDTTKHYDSVTLKIRRTGDVATAYTYNKPWATPSATYDTAWSASPASWTVNVKAWKPGVYECQLVGTTKDYPNKVYTFPVTIRLVD